MFTVVAVEPLMEGSICLDIDSTIRLDCFGKYGFRYIIGDLLSIMRHDLYEQLIATSWHPDRFREWCLPYDYEGVFSEL